jgi:hypothetical protein
LLGNTAYDGNGFREKLGERGTQPIIPNHPTRKQLFSFNKRLYKFTSGAGASKAPSTN